MMKDFAIENVILTGCNPDIVKADIPDGVTAIGNYAFDGCASLKSINIQDSVTSIGKFAFYGCENLESISIPDNVKFIDESAFWYCDNLTIHCSQGSYAKEYAKANNIPCELNDTPKHKAHDMKM